MRTRDGSPAPVLPLAARDALAGLLLSDLARTSDADASAVGAALDLLDGGSRSGGAAVEDDSGARALASAALVRAGLRRADEASPSVGARSSGASPAVLALAVDRLRAYAAILVGLALGSALPVRLLQARRLFAAQLFFEVHEVLEPPWQGASGEAKRHLQGVIQAAVACHHAAHGNTAGALRLAHAATDKLGDAPEWWHAFPMTRLRSATASFAARIAAGQDGDGARLAREIAVDLDPRGRADGATTSRPD